MGGTTASTLRVASSMVGRRMTWSLSLMTARWTSSGTTATTSETTDVAGSTMRDRRTMKLRLKRGVRLNTLIGMLGIRCDRGLKLAMTGLRAGWCLTRALISKILTGIVQTATRIHEVNQGFVGVVGIVELVSKLFELLLPDRKHQLEESDFLANVGAKKNVSVGAREVL